MAARPPGGFHSAALRAPVGRLPWVAASVVLVLGLVGTLVGASIFASQAQAQARSNADTEARRSADHVSSVLNTMGAFAQAVRVLVETDPDGIDNGELQSFMSGLYAQWGELRSVAAAPDNRVVAVAPVRGNEAVLGLNYPDSAEQWPAIRDAMRTGEPILVGPVALVQGGSGFIYRMPVFRPAGEYWGVVSAVVDAATLAPSAPGGSAFALRERGAAAAMILGSSAAFDSAPATATVTALGRQWDVAVPVTVDYQAGLATILLVGTLTSILLAILVFLLARTRDRENALAGLMRDLSDQAPGLLFQLRQDSDGLRTLTYLSAGPPGPVTRAIAERRDDMAALAQIILTEDRASVELSLSESASTGYPWHQRFRVQVPTDHAQELTWLLADARPQVAGDGSVIWHGWVSDVTEDLRGEEALRVSASLFDATRDGVAILDAAGRITDVNAGLEVISGFRRVELIGTPIADYFTGPTTEAVLDDMWQHLAQYGYWRGELTGRRNDGSARTDGTTAIAVKDPQGRLSHYIIVLDNMNLTRDDPVTGLPHSRFLDDEVRQAREGAPDSQSALVVIGLDHFRQVNDAYGHRIGDELLRTVADRLRSTVPPGCPLVRLRGDEFAFALTHADDLTDVDELTRAALAAIADPTSLSGHDVRVTAVAGISLSPGDATDVADMHRHANQAMRASKDEGPGVHTYFDADMNTALQERSRLLEDLPKALDAAQLSMVFQPIVDLRTGAITRAEALMRWHHPVLGHIAPDQFIPLAEENGWMVDLTDYAFAQSLDALTTMRAIAPGFQISVNLSPTELRAHPLHHQQRIGTITERGLPGSCLIVEITEGVVVSRNPVVDANLNAYRQAGLSIAIDDFGTGYSSLAYLQSLDVDFVKIDRTFVTAVSPASDGLALCEAIIEMAHKMGFLVIAEGVETESQNALLMTAGCDYAQGFLHARPMSLPGLKDAVRATGQSQTAVSTDL